MWGMQSELSGKKGLIYKKNSWIDLNKKIDFTYNQFVLNNVDWQSKKVLLKKKKLNKIFL